MKTQDFRNKILAVVFLVASLYIAPTVFATRIQISEDPVAPRADYNILLFENLKLDFTGEIGVLYDDNVNNSEDDEKEGIAVIPRLKMAVDWPLTPHIRIGTGVNIGFRNYISGDGEDGLFLREVGGGVFTGINADIFLGNGVLRLSEQFRRDASTIELGGRGNADDYARNRNTLSARYTVPLNPYISLITEMKHINTWVTPDRYEYQDSVRDVVLLNPLYQMNANFRIGPYLRWEQLDYDEDVMNDREMPEAGFSFLYQREAGLTLEGSAGYEMMDVDDTNPQATDEEDGFTGDLACHFSSSRLTTHTFSVSHDRKQSITARGSNFSKETRYTYAVSSNVMPDLTISGDVSYLDIKESDEGEDAGLYRVGLGTGYQLSRQLRANIRYEYTQKISDRAGSDFERNQVRVNLSYDF